MTSLNRKVLLNIPNLLTYSRIAVIPFITIFLMVQGPEHSAAFNRAMNLSAAFLFILAGISDIVDGYYARKYQMVSLMGKFIDPIADKLLHMAVMVLMIPMGRLPALLVLILLFREIVISGLRTIAAAEGMIIAAGPMGKRKTAWLNCGLSALLIYDPIFGISSYTVGWICMGIGTVYAIISGVEYLYLFYKHLKARDEKEEAS